MVYFTPFSLNTSKQDIFLVLTATLHITEQKQSFNGECVHHGALEGLIFACPVKVLVIRVVRIWLQKFDGTTILCAYWDSVGRGNVTDSDMRFYMIFAAAKLGYPSRNNPLDRIDTHSNRAGGECAMKLAGFEDEIIRKMGRWLPSLNAFLE